MRLLGQVRTERRFALIGVHSRLVTAVETKAAAPCGDGGFGTSQGEQAAVPVAQKLSFAVSCNCVPGSARIEPLP